MALAIGPNCLALGPGNDSRGKSGLEGIGDHHRRPLREPPLSNQAMKATAVLNLFSMAYASSATRR